MKRAGACRWRGIKWAGSVLAIQKETLLPRACPLLMVISAEFFG